MAAANTIYPLLLRIVQERISDSLDDHTVALLSSANSKTELVRAGAPISANPGKRIGLASMRATYSTSRSNLTTAKEWPASMKGPPISHARFLFRNFVALVLAVDL